MRKTKIYIGADHRGFPLKNKIVKLLGQRGYNVTDMGTFDETKSRDYPRVAERVAKKVAKSRDGRGILVCMSGIGQAIAANKVRGAYAALCYNAEANGTIMSLMQTLRLQGKNVGESLRLAFLQHRQGHATPCLSLGTRETFTKIGPLGSTWKNE